MHLSNEDIFSDAQFIDVTQVSTDVIDTRRTGIANSATEIPILVQVVEDFATSTSVQVQVQSDTTENFSSGAVRTLKDTGAILIADLVAGYQFSISILPHSFDRYLRLRYVVVGAASTAGNITAGFVTERHTNV